MGCTYVYLYSSSVVNFSFQVVANGSRIASHELPGEPDPFKVAKDLGIYKLIDSGSDMTTNTIITRIIDHRYEFMVSSYHLLGEEVGRLHRIV